MDNNLMFGSTDKAIGAFLGAACGDALGWPNERVGRSLSKTQTRNPLLSFQQWPRRSGGRFYPYAETIEAGAYSDDTQLMLCLSRSRLWGKSWWQHWTQVELPLWTVYERGGGGATKRAADAWLDGVFPWSDKRKPQEVARYFEAGGNGVAMRILPHIIAGGGDQSFSAVASNIFADGITTHGHPRALLGALLYGYALWKSLRRETPLEYGAIVEELLSDLATWSEQPKLLEDCVSWSPASRKFVTNYDSLWAVTVKELNDALTLCRLELAKGALVFEDEVLEQLKCFDRKVSGSGTVAAVAAVFLASRYAPDPLSGIVKAAFAFGSDTDTIASMTGGLLGVVCGTGWLSSLAQQVQDSKYISHVATQLLKQATTATSAKVYDVIKGQALQNWLDRVVNERDGQQIVMPDGRTAKISSVAQHIGNSGKYQVIIKKAVSEEGQSIFLTKISKGSFKPKEQKTVSAVQVPPAAQESRMVNFSTRILVNSFEDSTWFYHIGLGLSVKKQEKDLVVFENGLVLSPKSYSTRLPKDVHPCSVFIVAVTSIELVLQRLLAVHIRIVRELSPWGKELIPSFTCLDPDGNVVEVFSGNRKG